MLGYCCLLVLDLACFDYERIYNSIVMPVRLYPTRYSFNSTHMKMLSFSGSLRCCSRCHHPSDFYFFKKQFLQGICVANYNSYLILVQLEEPVCQHQDIFLIISSARKMNSWKLYCRGSRLCFWWYRLILYAGTVVCYSAHVCWQSDLH